VPACAKPGIEAAAAGGPQARGCEERNRAPDRDRLAKELRLAGIPATGEADRFLVETYLGKTNGKFSLPAPEPANARTPPGNANPADIPCFEYGRTASNDYAAGFECRLFQILKVGKALPRRNGKVTAGIRPDGSLSMLRRGKTLLVEEIQINKKGLSNSGAA
jgi:hypothetical protein